MWQCFLIFGVLPLVISILKPRSWIYILLWLFTLQAWWTACRKHGYDLQADWNPSALDKATVKRILLRFLPFAAFLLFFTWWMIPERLFSFPLERPQTWAIVMIWYPVLSVFPQEILFRAFFFRHYAPWLKNERDMLLVNAAVFGWIHVVLQNWVAVAFSAVGGWLFAHTYAKTRSLAAVCFEHALYGCWVFTLGLGWYFYHGNAVR